jgi:glycosyltransferase involved in cell wall biosynthesis
MNTVEKIIILIPAYNEAAHITDVVEQSKKYLSVLVIDDGSTDQTAILAEKAGAKVLQQKPNQGKGAAFLVGFRDILDQNISAVITLDADGQHDPDEIPAFLNNYQLNHPDLIIGKREFSKMPIVRRISNTFGRILISWAMGCEIMDNQSGYRLISRKLVEKMINSRESGFEFEIEMIILCIKQGCRLNWIPIRTIYADEKSHIKPIKHAINYLRVVFQAWKTMHYNNT